MRYGNLQWLPAFCGLYSIVLQASATPVTETRWNKTCRRTKVAVLGAGVAGITAAQALTNASIADFIIVERNDYIGGRMAHTNFGNKEDGTPYTVELGANWVQGLQSPGGPINPIWRLAKKYGLHTTYDNTSSVLTYDETGYNDYSHLIDLMDEKSEIAGAHAGNILSQNLQDTNARAGLKSAGWDAKKNMHAQAVEWYYWDNEAAGTPTDSSFAYGFAGNNLTYNIFNDEDRFCVDQRGFNHLIIGEANEFLEEDDDRLMLNTTVKGIEYCDGYVTITLDDGACIEADHAIVTFSVGVLQNDVVKFKPALPDWKTEAINLMQMTTFTKIFLQFNETFWDTNTTYFMYADPQQRGWYPWWKSLDGPGYMEGSHIIFAIVTGDQSYQVEAQTLEQTQHDAMVVLRRMFGDDIPEPMSIMHPRWSEEAWAHGSYSNWPVGMTLERHQNLRANVGRVWFAGEATSAEYFGFLHGAWLEGQEVGARIAGMLGGEKIKVGLYGNYTVSGPMRRFEVLHASTFLKEYNIGNGWPVSPFQTYDDSRS